MLNRQRTTESSTRDSFTYSKLLSEIIHFSVEFLEPKAIKVYEAALRLSHRSSVVMSDEYKCNTLYKVLNLK